MLTSVAFGAGDAAPKQAVTPNLNQGTKVLEGSGSVDGDKPVGTETKVALGFGYFIKDNLELAAVGGLQDNDYITIYEAGARIEYNITLDSPVVPFVGAGVLWAGADPSKSDADSVDTTVGRAIVGVKYFVRDDVALAFSGVYDKAADDLYIDEDGKAQDDNFKGLFGIRFYFD
jgi:outer membrane protein W